MSTITKRSTSRPPANARPTAPAARPREDATPAVDRARPVTAERIQARAFEIYLARGGRPGDAESDWLAAERELTGAVSGTPVSAEIEAKARERGEAILASDLD